MVNENSTLAESSPYKETLVLSPRYSPLNSAHNPGSCCDSNPRFSEHSVIAEGQKDTR